MPLLDHFNPPLSLSRRWRGLLHAWATNIAANLNARLPEFHVALANIHYGIDIDNASTEKPESIWNESPIAPVQSIPLPFLLDIVEVQVLNQSAAQSLVAAIEIATPLNKDSREHRDAWTSKCKSIVQVGSGLMMIDIVTEPQANLHADLVDALGSHISESHHSPLYVASYHPVERDKHRTLDLWYEPLTTGKPLPILPLWLKGGLCLTVDLEETYQQTCRGLRIEQN